ncbi:MAG: tetratricopeptide repeat protein [Polyangiaceae bacterium]|nr:tetratricopeptide repeat protein [Polyangiaceae bacterium]
MSTNARRAPALLWCAALCGALGCDGGRGGAAPRPSSLPSAAPDSTAPASAPPAPRPGPLEPAAARGLALSDPGGDGAVDREIRGIQRQIAAAGQRVDPWILLGRAWVRKARESADPGFYLNADACAGVALDIEPGDRMSLDLRGLALLSAHRFADARDLAEQILAKDPDDAMAIGTLSDALLELGRFPEAAAAAQRMVDLKPNLPSYARASYMRWLQGDGRAAKSIIRLAIDARDPRDPEPGAWVLVQAAMLFWHEGDHDGADKGFDRALDAVSEYPPALAGKARVALATGDHARAIELIERAYRQSPLVETAWLLGDARQAAGDAAGAAEAYARVVRTGRQTDPRTLALYYATRDLEREEAVRLAEAERRVRDDIYTADTLAWALYRAGKIPEARAASDRAIALGTRDARLLYHAGAIRIAAGDRAGAALVREALRLNPKFDVTGAAEA